MELTPEEQQLILEHRSKRTQRGVERSHAVRRLQSITPEEKIAFFDRCYAAALSHLTLVEQNHCSEEDSKQHCYELTMQTLALDVKAFWNYYNSQLQ